MGTRCPFHAFADVLSMSSDSAARSLFGFPGCQFVRSLDLQFSCPFPKFLDGSGFYCRFLLLHRQQFDSSRLSWIYNGFIMESSWVYHGFILESEVCRDRFEEPRFRQNQGKQKPKAVFPRQPSRNRGEINYLVNNPPYPTHIRGL